MTTNKEVFAKRKEGALDEAYQMALILMQGPQISDWDFKAFAWCLIDLIKRGVKVGNDQNIDHYRQQLQAIKLDPNDDVLSKSVRYALSLCNPHGQLISQAKELSKQGRHKEAVNLYRNIWLGGSADRDVQTSLGWELYKLCKEQMALDNVNLGAVKLNLNDYLKLDVEKPSLLHTCILQLAEKLSGQDGFNMLAFSRMWNLDYLRTEDFERYHGDDGKEYPSLAEKVFQQASKDAAKSDNAHNLNYILPYINTAINKFPDNIWLQLNKAKLLLALGRNDDALAFGLTVTKSKVNDYWAWELLGDICAANSPDIALSCYCKALLNSNDDKFTGKLRLKLAERMAERGDYSSARGEVERVISYRESEGQRIPEDATRLASQPWYRNATATSSNLDYYKSRAPVAESLLFSQLPWIRASIGEKFTIPGKEGKPKRKIYIETDTVPMEVSIPESKGSFRGFAIGDAFKLKGELDNNGHFQVYVVEGREEGTPWDIFPEKIGVIDHINQQKKLIHFIVDRKIDGIVSLSELNSAFSEGDAIALKLAKFNTKDGVRHHVLAIKHTSHIPDSAVRKDFCEVFREERGMGFTSNDIFVPPFLMSQHNIQDGDLVSGLAIINYNKKRGIWGWKAVTIKTTQN